MNQIPSNKVLAGSNNSLKGTSFIVFLIVLFTILIVFNTCEKPVREIQMNTFDAKSEDISFTTAILKGEITDLGSLPIEDHGILISPNSTPNIGNSNVVSLGKCSARGGFQVKAENLDKNTTYFFRAFLNVDDEYVYADLIREFRTKDCNFATVATAIVSSVTTSTASTGGNVSADGGAPVTARGVCWSTSTNPAITTADTTVDGEGTGFFSSSITGLTDNTTYHVRAYATNAAGTTYGDDVSFITSGTPEVTTSPISLITASSASSGGNVISDRGYPVTARGVCWSTSPNPTIITLDKTSDGAGSGPYTSNITGLYSGTTYHIRAYATNSEGTGYGEVKTFNTWGIPDVTTNAISLITSTSATSGGIVNSDGGTPVIEKGVCWSTSTNPTTANSHTSDGSGTDPFTSNIIGLTFGTIYHVRAYAINSVGTAYGNDILFNTFLPTVVTELNPSFTYESAVSGGNVTSNGGAVVTEKGVCWSTTVNPTIGNSHTIDGSGTGAFISNISGLTRGTSYHVRAYATNSVGTAYGNDVSFTTWDIPTVLTIDVSAITTSTATSGGDITSDGGTPVISKGVCWSTSPDPTIDLNTKTADGTGKGIFISYITGLAQSTTYYLKAYATNSAGTAYGNQVSFQSDFLCGTNFIDRSDNQSYWTVKIGNQCWFAENLNAGIMIDGSLEQTNNVVLEKYCYDNLESNCDIYGGLYQWDEMMQYVTFESSKGVCPVGWHVPSDTEWKILEMTLGMSETEANKGGWRGTTEGGALKSKLTYFWDPPNEGATNSSQFTALPSGNRTNTGIFESKGFFTDFWTSTNIIEDHCIYRLLDAAHSQIYRTDGLKQFATPVRCLRD